MLRRAKEKRLERHITDELSEGVSHFRSAAALAAEQAAHRLAPAVETARSRAQTTVGPRLERAVDAAVEAWENKGRPAMTSAASGTAGGARTMSRKARRQARTARKRGRRLAGRASDKALRRAGKATASANDELGKRRWGRWVLGALGVGAALGAAGALIRRRRAAEWEEEHFGYGDSSGSVTPMPSGASPATNSTATSSTATGASEPGDQDTAKLAAGSFSSGTGGAASPATSAPESAPAAHEATGADRTTPPEPGAEQAGHPGSPTASGAKKRVGEAAETAKRKAADAVETAKERAAAAKKRTM